ncbi:MAG: hypothetical protein LBE20_02460 [Deltaproteobacteria bacterium]|jgi:hypothetical protein|nr:hypothetical protein [Deltaproteobacteria bacterium]
MCITVPVDSTNIDDYRIRQLYMRFVRAYVISCNFERAQTILNEILHEIAKDSLLIVEVHLEKNLTKGSIINNIINDNTEDKIMALDDPIDRQKIVLYYDSFISSYAKGDIAGANLKLNSLLFEIAGSRLMRVKVPLDHNVSHLGIMRSVVESLLE